MDLPGICTRPRILCLALGTALSGSATAQPESPAEPLIIPRINGPATLDGFSNEPAWENIAPLPLTMYQPNAGSAPSERTEIRLAYDDENLYAAGRMYDQTPDEIRAPSKKRDQIGPANDWFAVILDTFNDNENALAFFTSPTGLRTDLAVFNDAQGVFPANVSWNTFWDVATKRNADGWFAEMRIPLSSLRFQTKAGRAEMGLILMRIIARNFEFDTFPAIEPKWGFFGTMKPSVARKIVLEGLQSKKPFYVTPYLLGGGERAFSLDETESAYAREDRPTFEAGLDIKYGPTSNLTLDLTLNTDFAQVEADNQQINLTRFSLFFPEKRMFFQERSSIFDFGFGEANRLFYSRRIGIHDGSPVRIYGGARLVGRTGGWDIGMLDMQTAPFEEVSSENFGVFRARRQVFNPYSYVGGIVTSRIGAGGDYNTSYGLDGIMRLFGDDYLDIKWAQTFENDSEKNSSALDPARVYVNWERRSLNGVAYALNYSRAGSSYDPGIGFEMREDFTRFGGRFLYGWMPGVESPILRHQTFVDVFAFLNNSDGQVESAEIFPQFRLQTKTGATLDAGLKFSYEDVSEAFSLSDDADVPAGEYRFYGVSSRLQLPRSGALSSVATLDAGSFYDGWRVSWGVEPTWNVSSSLELSGAYGLNWISFPERDQRFVTSLAQLRALVMFSVKLSLSAFVQYNSAADLVIANVRLRYNPREGNDFYVVYNEGRNTDRFREIPTLPQTSARTLLLKYTYTFAR